MLVRTTSVTESVPPVPHPALCRSGLATCSTPREFIHAILYDFGLGCSMELVDGRPGDEGSSHLDDLDALLQVADLQPDPDRFEAWLRAALDGPRASDGDPTVDAARGVTLSTVHRVKGREWPHVVVFGEIGRAHV